MILLDRLLNYIFGFILVLFYVLFANPDEQTRITIALLLASTIALLAFLMNWLSLDGAFAALIIGIVALGLGGLSTAIALLLFFSSSYFIGFVLGSNKVDGDHSSNERRDGRQVWANAFWFVLFISLGFYFRDDLMRIIAAGALAVAMADTWATEIGTKAKNTKTYFILNFKPVQTGIDGGVSLIGSLGGILGGLLLSIAFVLVSGYHSLVVFGIIALAGFLGCVMDSYLGAIFQTNNRKFYLTKQFGGSGKLDNNSVNVVATGLGALITLCMLLIV